MDTTLLREKTKKFFSIFQEKFIINQRIIYTIFFYVSIIFALAMIAYWYNSTNELDKQSPSLGLVSSYSLDSLYNNETIKEVSPFWKSIDDILKFNVQMNDAINTNESHRKNLSLPFDNFLNLFYTPSLNIWRDPFKQTIDTTLIGEKYLKANPYGDIALMEKWTDFFKDVGISDGYNKINNINIGSIEQSTQEGYFSITINVDFESPDKRSFLLLVNKLSMTAYLENLSLTNEFVFHVWNNIKEERGDLLTNTQERLKETLPYISQDKDRLIGYLLYERVKNDGENALISNSIITKSIRQTAGCIDETQQQCNYIFRQKMRNIPYLAYGVARDGVDSVGGFKTFFQYLPPILSIEQFSFEEIKKTRLNNGAGYKGSIAIKVYGKDIMNDEINTISNELGIMCFASKESMNSSSATIRVEKNINDLGVQSFDTRRSLMLSQILDTVNTISTSYDSLPNYKKVVKLFELYRTLKENNLCDIVDTTKGVTPLLGAEIPDSLDDIVDNNLPTLLSGDNIPEQPANPLGSGDQLIQSGANNNLPPETTPGIQTGPVNIIDESISIVTGFTATVGGIDDRTIGDGNSPRDTQLKNELE